MKIFKNYVLEIPFNSVLNLKLEKCIALVATALNTPLPNAMIKCQTPTNYDQYDSNVK